MLGGAAVLAAAAAAIFAGSATAHSARRPDAPAGAGAEGGVAGVLAGMRGKASALLAGGGGGEADGCTMEVGEPREMRLSDGSIPYVAPWSMTRSGNRYMMLGMPAYRWAGDARAADEPLDSTRIIGLVIDDHGRASAVEHPFPGRQVLGPRSVPRAEGGWFVLLGTSDLSAYASLAADSPAEIWFGVFNDGQWSELERIGTVSGRLLRPEASSALVHGSEGELAFAHVTSGETGHGLVLLRRKGREWTADTLDFGRRVFDVDLAIGGSAGSWTMSFNPARLGEDWLSFSSHIVDFSSGWGQPRAVVNPNHSAPFNLRIFRNRDRLFGIWVSNNEARELVATRWSVLDPDAPVLNTNGSFISWSPEFVAVPLDAGRTLVLTRSPAGDRGVEVRILGGDGLQDLGTIETVNSTGPAAAAAADGSVLLITSTAADRMDMPPVALTSRRVLIRC